MKQLNRISLIFASIVNFSLSAKILCVFPVPFYSHQKVLRIVPEELAKSGHEVVIITPEPTGVLTDNITEINVSEVSYAKWNEMFASKTKHLKTFTMSPSKFLEIASEIMYPVTEVQINHPDVQELLSKDNKFFDLILAEDCPRTSVIFGAKFQAPIVLISSFFGLHESFEHVGSETNPLLLPFCQKSPENFWESISIYLEAMMIKFIMNLSLLDNHMIKRYFGRDAPSVEEVRNNVKMLFLSMDHMWDNNRAVGPAVNYMGAIHLEKPRHLPQDLCAYLNSSSNGVIYMSLGSKIRASDLPPHIITVILRVFASLPYDVLWKWDGGDLPNKPKNVRLEKWLPQADLLHHPSIKLFISQGGLQSTDEAIAANVPLLGLPILADQYQNVQKYKEYGIGTGMDIDILNEDEFRRAILNVAENETYRKNIRRLSSIISDRRVNGVKRAVHQVQHFLDHGFPFQSPAANISFTEYFMLDVFGPLLAAVLIAAIALVFTVQRLLRSVKEFCIRKKVR